MKKKERLEEYVVFGLGEEYYGVKINSLERILSNDYVRYVPNTLEIVEGIVHNEEQIIPIINLKKKFKLKKQEKVNYNSYIIVYKQNNQPLGFYVDHLYESLETQEEIRSENNYIPETILPYTEGVLHFQKDKEKEILIVLDLNKISI